MKKVVVLVAFIMSMVTFAQEKITEGVLTQVQTMSSSNEEVNNQLAMMGEMITTTYFKDGKSRSELSSPMMGSSISIIDTDKKEMLILMNNPMMGKKYLKKSIEEQKEASDDVKVEKTTETKTILGYVCTKYNVEMTKKGTPVKMTVYTTEALDISSKKTVDLGDKLKGFPMYTEMTITQMGAEIVIKIEVKTIKKETVDASKFEMVIPDGYEKSENIPGM